MKLLVIFIVLNIVNVIIQTVKSLATINSGKTVAATVNAVCYGLYTVVLVYTMCDLPLWLKAIIVGLCNFIGVFIVKLIDEKKQKTKIWKIEISFKHEFANDIMNALRENDIKSYYTGTIKNFDGSDYIALNVFSNTKKESHVIRETLAPFVKQDMVKYFVTETKIL